MTITEELLADLDAKATASDEDIIRSHGWVGFVDDLGLLRKDKAFVTAASPGVVRALIAHIRSLEARVEKAEKFARFVKKCLVQNGEYAPLSHQEVDEVLRIGGHAIAQEGAENE